MLICPSTEGCAHVKNVSLALAAVYAGNWVRLCLRSRARAQYLDGVAAEKLDARNTRRAAAKAVLPAFADIPEALRVSQMTVAELSAAMASGELTSELVVTIACARALQAGEELGCNAEERFLEAVEEAVLRDKQRAEGNVLGPLHGIPFSVKDQVHMAGFDSSYGNAAKLFRPRKEDSLLVKILRDAGGVPFVRSNMPQAGMLPETVNHIYGTTCNPYNLDRSSGGSSGGEGVLVATGASPLGIGTDIGGSVRIPALNCGVVGFKPTSQRMSSSGIAAKKGDGEGPQGQYHVVPAAGPLARCVADCDLAMQLWCNSMSNTDTTIPPQPWASQVKETRRLRFGVIRYDGFFPACTAVERAVDIAVEGLQRDGHEVVDFCSDGYNLSWNGETFSKLMQAEGNLHSLVASVDGERLHKYYSFFYLNSQIPRPVRWILGKILGLLGKTRVQKIMEGGYALDARSYMEAIHERDEHKRRMVARMQEMGIDALLCAQMGVPAMLHGKCSRINIACSYTFLFNNVHFPAGNVPVTYVDEDEQHYDTPCERFADTFEAFTKENMVASAGLPVGVQVATLPFRDELCLRAMLEVERAVAQQMVKPTLSRDTAMLKAVV